jgi:SAM-dependent methyltransferase
MESKPAASSSCSQFYTPLPSGGEPSMTISSVLRSLMVGTSLMSVALTGCSQLPTSIANARTPEQSTQVQRSRSANQAQTTSPTAQTPKLDVPYVPTPPEVVNAMLRVANVSKDDLLYDLGSGDGRIPITAAKKFGTRGVGIDIDPQRIQEANANARKEGVSDRVKFMQQDLFKTDLNSATVITLYLLPEVNLRLRPRLLQLKPGTRIVSHAFDMGDWKPEKVLQVSGRTIYYWVVPEKPPENLRS